MFQLDLGLGHFSESQQNVSPFSKMVRIFRYILRPSEFIDYHRFAVTALACFLSRRFVVYRLQLAFGGLRGLGCKPFGKLSEGPKNEMFNNRRVIGMCIYIYSYNMFPLIPGEIYMHIYIYIYQRWWSLLNGQPLEDEERAGRWRFS